MYELEKHYVEPNAQKLHVGFDKPQAFYVVWADGMGSITRRMADKDQAREECVRLAKKYPGTPIFVLESIYGQVGAVDVTPIEVVKT